MWDQLEVVNQITSASLRKWLGEDICKFIFGGDGEKLESTMDKMITDKMTINLDVFSIMIIIIIFYGAVQIIWLAPFSNCDKG